ncbi:hypothetical protein BV25DRAFT_1842766 [Artomyces pyxidatus]|uniref:Uncharacterized protein n=1 Tax=Artomyces pyxidatus TaxID=48021 RepID=A0ACB8SHL7_9AGAM|nr:hypothetical protein BV25DRAFT_1842766 [Artomyces pyxidatus]
MSFPNASEGTDFPALPIVNPAPQPPCLHGTTATLNISTQVARDANLDSLGSVELEENPSVSVAETAAVPTIDSIVAQAERLKEIADAFMPEGFWVLKQELEDARKSIISYLLVTFASVFLAGIVAGLVVVIALIMTHGIVKAGSHLDDCAGGPMMNGVRRTGCAAVPLVPQCD